MKGEINEALLEDTRNDAYLEVLTELDKFCHTLVHLALDECQTLPTQTLFLVGHEITERRWSILNLKSRKGLGFFFLQKNSFALLYEPWQYWQQQVQVKEILQEVIDSEKL